jgi:DNA-binding MarR family transcriptional regulator
MDREDLGALAARITRRLVDAEQPLLAAHGLSMWAYDKTRLVGLLDELERDGLISRTPDPADRRARIVDLTDAGRARHAAAQADVRAMEDDFLSDLSAAERDRLHRVLARLAGEDPQ